MKNGWIKYFSDGSFEEGWDELVDTQQASWSKGRLESMSSAEMYYNDKFLILSGEGKYWQSDTYEAQLLVNEGRLIKRTLYRKLSLSDSTICFHGDKIISIETRKDRMLPCAHRIEVKPEWVDKWFSFSLFPSGNSVWNIEDI